VDQIYDGLLENKVRPFVELSFQCPETDLGRERATPVLVQAERAPPKDWGKWEQFIEAFARHLVQRYGEQEVARWYFEVWNEPNIDFWAGNPKEATYYELYDHAARAIKRVSARLRVGGPSTAQAAWAESFSGSLQTKNVPVRFCPRTFYETTARRLRHARRSHDWAADGPPTAQPRAHALDGARAWSYNS